MNKKKLIPILLALTTAFSCFSGIASAEAIPTSVNQEAPEFNKEHQLIVESLIDELVAVRLEKEILTRNNSVHSSSSSSTEELSQKEKDLENQLIEEGVRPITEEERTKMNESSYTEDLEGGITPLAGPPTWGPYPNVDMLTYGEKTITVNGRSYTIWINYAVPREGGGGPLVKHHNSVKLIKAPFEFSKARTKVFDFLLQRAVGRVKYANWTFYDYFWPSIQGYTSFQTYDLLLSTASKMKYVWVKNGTVWQLKAHSNNVQSDETHVTRGYKNNSLQTEIVYKKNYAWGDLYDQIETLAVSEGNTVLRDPVRALVYTDEDGRDALTTFPYYASGPLELFP
ncbi:hypothetical protein JCM10914A_06580 [Paenibacillus sp. JCM 10914]|uniref:hypothetical protein n=1 Tax=Paenibacillus sp. JCM 10914 TaxID=1236974 RepID=UPI0003CC5429|nr:hypothetical protein [Paenibacillus sp. JCM 10914]GAE05840.1 hypothetical protein JCM10914_1966 [Paenibacillus sp. JCM 10914]